MAQIKLDYEAPAHLKGEVLFQTAGILPPNAMLFGINTIPKVGGQVKTSAAVRQFWLRMKLCSSWVMRIWSKGAWKGKG